MLVYGGRLPQRLPLAAGGKRRPWVLRPRPRLPPAHGALTRPRSLSGPSGPSLGRGLKHAPSSVSNLPGPRSGIMKWEEKPYSCLRVSGFCLGEAEEAMG